MSDAQDRKLEKIVGFVNTLNNTVNDQAKEIANLTVQVQEAKAKAAQAESRANAAMAMRGHGATT